MIPALTALYSHPIIGVCMCVVHMCVFLTYVLVCTFFGGICQCVFCMLYGCCVDQITKIHYN